MRQYSSSSEEDIEKEIDDRNLSYRHGWPQLPSLPVTTDNSGAYKVANAEEHIDEVEEILKHEEIQPNQMFFAYRIPKDQESDFNYLTLVIPVDSTLERPFKTAIIRIRQYLMKNATTSSIMIEMIDYRAIHGLQTGRLGRINRDLEAIVEAYDEASDIAINEIANAKRAGFASS